MTARLSPNRDSLKRTARRLRPVLDEVVFVGGHVAELLVSDRAIPAPAPLPFDLHRVQHAAGGAVRAQKARHRDVGVENDPHSASPSATHRFDLPLDSGRV